MAIAKEQLQQIIANNNIKIVGAIYSLFKGSFKDMFQEILEAELNASFGQEKINKGLLILITSAMDILQKR